MADARAETAAGGPVGVIAIPDGFDALARVAGVPALLRHALGFASAGVQRLWIAGASPEQLAGVRADDRLSSVVVLDDASALEGASHALCVSCETTVHRGYFVWAAARPAPTAIEGHGGDALLAVPASAFDRLREQLDRALPEFPELEARFELPAPLFALPAIDAASRRAAVRPHLLSLVKPTGGVLDRHLMRPVSLQMTRSLMNTAVSPNVITVLTLVLALAAAALVGSVDPSFYIVGALLHFFVRILDCVDGELARLRYEGTAFGQWLDTVGDGIGVAALVAAVTYKTAPVAAHWLWIGVVGIALYLLVQVLQLQIAKRDTGGGSLQAVDWAFKREGASGVDRFVGLIHNFVRIDFISTAYAVLVIVDQGPLLLIAHLAASTGGALYLLGQALGGKDKGPNTGERAA